MIIYIFLFFIIFYSCKKHEDTTAPTIQIILPNVNSQFSVIDTIQVAANITDDNLLTNVSVYILNDEAQNISGVKSFAVNTKEYKLNTFIILDNIRLKGGAYSIVVSASDTENNKKSYRDIYLTSINKKLEKIVLITEDQNNTYVFEEDISKTFVQKYTYNGLLCDAEINSYYNSLLLLTKSGELISVNTENYEAFWQNNNLNIPNYEYKGHLLINDDLAYVSQKENSIVAYSYNNIIRKTSVSELSDYLPSIFTIHNDFIVSSTYSKGISVNKIEKFYFSTGASQTSINLNYEPIEILPSFDNSVVVFGNLSNNSIISAFYLEFNTLQELCTIDNENIISVCKITEDEFILATNINTYMFNSNTKALYTLKNSYSPQHIFYDDLNQIVYCCLDNEVKSFTLPYFQEINSIIKSYKITKVLFKYNY